MNEKQLNHIKGTTSVGLSCKDGVILAADTRATGGYLVASKRARKVYKITDNIGISVAGSVGDTQELVRILRGETNFYRMREGMQMSVRGAAKLTANVLHQYRLLPYLAILLVGGMDESGSRLCLLGLDGSLIEEKKVVIGSGSPIAHGVLESEFREDMSVEDALPLTVKALKSAMERDIMTGNELKVATLTVEGYRELPSEEIENLGS